MELKMPNIFEVNFRQTTIGAMTDATHDSKRLGIGYTKYDMGDQTIIPHFKHMEKSNPGLQLILQHMNDFGQATWLTWDFIEAVLKVYARRWVEEQNHQHYIEINEPLSKPSNLSAPFQFQEITAIMNKYYRETLSFTSHQTKLLDKIAEHKNASKAYIMRTAFDFWCDNIGKEWLPNKGD